jgi:hypothetical protein
MEEKRIMEPGKVECMTSRTFCLIGICLELWVSTQNRHRWLQYAGGYEYYAEIIGQEWPYKY